MKKLNQDYNFTKSLKQYIREGLRLSINKCIPIMSESLRIGINDKPEILQPQSWDELKQIIEDRYKELGPGIEQEPINFNDIDVSKITTFYYSGGIFEDSKFEYIDVSEWDVSNVTNMRTTFFNCTNLKSVGDLSHWDVSKVKDMTAMFTNCKKLESIDLSQWDVSNVQYMWDMFINCKNLKFINDLSKWDISSVEIMTGMFTNSGITNIPKWYKE